MVYANLKEQLVHVGGTAALLAAWQNRYRDSAFRCSENLNSNFDA